MTILESYVMLTIVIAAFLIIAGTILPSRGPATARRCRMRMCVAYAFSESTESSHAQNANKLNDRNKLIMRSLYGYPSGLE